MMGMMMGWIAGAEQGWRKGPWTPEEDKLLSEYVSTHGEGRWSSVARSAGLNRSGKSCRLRWVNYLRPGLKRGQMTPQEEGIIIELHALWGNKWSTIARYLPGRTDNEIKNYWRTHIKKKERSARKSSDRRKTNNRAAKIKAQAQAQAAQYEQVEVGGRSTSTGISGDNEEINQVIIPTLPQETTLMHPAATATAMMDYPSLSPSTSSWMDEDSLFWCKLWNFSDHQQEQFCSKMALSSSSSLQNQATATNTTFAPSLAPANNGLFASSWGGLLGDLNNNLYTDQGYIF